MATITRELFSEILKDPVRLAAQIEYFSDEMHPLKDFLEANISEWLGSPEFKMMAPASIKKMARSI